MPELRLQHTGELLTVTLDENVTSIPFADIAPPEDTWQCIYDDALAYGRDLFDKTFRDEQMRTMLANLPANERLLLVADDPLVAAIPWEYLRDQNNKLLASRLNFVRGIPEARRKDSFAFNGPLEIITIPVSPVNEPRILNVEREWKNLVEAVTVTTPPKSLILKRVRPPTRNQLERSMGRQCTSIVHFMGHSMSHDGKAFLVFEDARARKHLVDAADFTDSLNDRVFLVVLNSCFSAVVAPTEFGNIAQVLVYRGIPYALGMQFILPDDAALVLSEALYDFLLQEHSVEEAVMHTRRAFEEPGKLSNPAWLAGIPVLYTSRRTPAPPIELETGQPTIQPDPQRLEKTCDLTAMPQAKHFVGRGDEISEVLDALMAHRPADFVVLHGLGGIGKTTLARAMAERVSYHYGDRVLAVSFETFATLDTQGQAAVNEQFADRFYNQLAHFYGLDPTAYNMAIDLQRAILQQRMHLRSLLVLDNIETLIDAQARGQPVAKALATFISRLKEGDGAILLTSRIVPPIDWGDCKIVSVSGLSDDAGGSLLLALLPPDRRVAALPEMHRKLSQRVKGHPLSIRLLAGRFAESTTDLEDFLQEIDAELQAAEQATPTSLEDPERQATLYACMDYSVKRLTPDQRKVLDAVSLFQASFLPEFAAHLLNDEEQTPVHLQTLVLLGLLNMEVRAFKEGELVLLELHPMLRWYIQHHLADLGADLLERYGQVYEQTARQAYQPEGGYDQSSLMRYLVRQILPDCEAALKYLPPAARSSLAYHLAKPYRRLGQNRHALALNEQALELYQELGDVGNAAATQHAMADVLSQLGKPQEALALYEQSLRTDQELGDVRGVAVTQHAMADVLSQQGQPQEALALYEQALHTMREVGDIREVAATQANYCRLLFQQGRHHRALVMAWDAYTSLRQSGFSYDAQVILKLLMSIKEQVLGPAQFDTVWREAIDVPQPEWLRDVRADPSPRQTRDAEFFTAIRAILDSQQPALPDNPPYVGEVREILTDIAAGGPQDDDSSLKASDEVMQAVRDFTNAKDWETTRQVVEAQQELLFRSEVEALFEQNIAHARTAGDERTVELLEMHLAFLQACKNVGIAEAFEQLLAAQEEAVPFDAELIPRSVAALLGSAQQKLAHMQYLAEQASKATDDRLKALIRVIQLALFSNNDLSQLGRDLQGVYREAWETIATSVEADSVDAPVFEAIVHNTLAVLGPAANRRGEWRTNLVGLRNGATTQGQRNLAALLDAVIGLLDAGGNPAGLGEGLKGIFAQTWWVIVEGLSK